MSVTIKAFLRKSLPVLAGGAIALSAATAANAASGYKMINPEDFKRGDYDTPYYLYDFPYYPPTASAPAGSEEGGSPELGGFLSGERYCVYASLHFPQGALLENIKLHVGGEPILADPAEMPPSYYNFDVEIWKVSPDRTQLNTLLSENISSGILVGLDAPAEGHTPDPYEFSLNETSNPKKFLYTLQMCGYGEIFSGRIYYSIED